MMDDTRHDVRDRRLRCADCGHEFVLTAREQDFFAGKGLSQPKRCGPCRQVRRQHARDAAQGLDAATT